MKTIAYNWLYHPYQVKKSSLNFYIKQKITKTSMIMFLRNWSA